MLLEFKQFFPKIFQKHGRTECVTLAICSYSGKTPFCIDKLKIWSNSLCKEPKQCLTIFKLIPS